MPSVTLSVPEIHCDHCKASIEGAVRPLPGVHAVTVDVPTRTVVVDLAPDTELAGVERAIVDVGFDIAGVVD